MWLKNLQHFLNLCDNFQFNAVWDRRTKATQTHLCIRLAESGIPATLSLTHTDYVSDI